MKIVEQNPPNIIRIKEVFGDFDGKKPVFCYGDTIFNPFKIEVLQDLIVHESVHCEQQGNLPEVWWSKYLMDRNYRLNQELEAYSSQYSFLKMVMKGKLLDYGLDSLAYALSGELYGNLLSFGEARSKIRMK